MTKGTIWKQLLLFAVPLVLGDLFQQLYNIADSIIVGNYLGKAVLAAVGSTANIINVLIGLFSGISTGATVIIAQLFGAKENGKLQDAVHTAMLLTFMMSFAFTMIGIWGTPVMLRVMCTPDDVYAEAETYLQIYFSGISGLILYNMSAGILRAAGDSIRPLYFLIAASFLNIGFDLLFITVFGMGVEGAALATIISQFISAFILLYILCRPNNIYRFCFRKLRLNPSILKQIINVGLPLSIQKSLVAFSNTIVVSYVNRFGSGAMAGWSVHQRVDQILNRTIQSMSVATTTFAGQNAGARLEDRISSGVKAALRISLLLTIACTGITVVFRYPLIRLFTSDEEVLYCGGFIIKAIAPLHVFNCSAQILAGELRGEGDSRGPMAIMLFCYIVLRQIYLNCGWPYFRTLGFIITSYPLSCLICTIALLIYKKRKGAAGFHS